jgi:hypothetical protein
MLSNHIPKLFFSPILRAVRTIVSKTTRMNPYTLSLADGILSNQRHSLAKAITLIESSRADHRTQADLLMAYLAKHLGESLKRKESLRLGVAGPPGKSIIQINT